MKKSIAHPTTIPSKARDAGTYTGQPGMFIAANVPMKRVPAMAAHSITLLPALRLATRQNTQQ